MALERYRLHYLSALGRVFPEVSYGSIAEAYSPGVSVAARSLLVDMWCCEDGRKRIKKASGSSGAKMRDMESSAAFGTPGASAWVRSALQVMSRGLCNTHQKLGG